MSRLWRAFVDLLLTYALKFGAVGLVGYVVDVGVFNALRLDLSGDGPLLGSSFAAKALSVTVATLVTWFGNRWWTFRDRRRSDALMELVEFAGIAVAGMGIALGCLAFSHYVLGLRSLVADNIAANVVGLAFATVFRFLMYRYWVYGDRSSHLRVVDRRPAVPTPDPGES